MKVFIENEQGSDKKNIFNEKTLEYSRSYTVSARYPFPYGFLLNTTSGDGDNLDCFLLTSKPFKSGEVVEAEPIGMYEQVENGETDHKILAVPVGDAWSVDEKTEQIFREFAVKVFSHLPKNDVQVGQFLGVEEANALIQASQD
ncbi:MAG TPA: inorganic diphosphatase [Candidatus Paceibacterota bacterium]|nr:inorganic diphosphatase [Candidatus Paceibacterota bacterium]